MRQRWPWLPHRTQATLTTSAKDEGGEGVWWGRRRQVETHVLPLNRERAVLTDLCSKCEWVNEAERWRVPERSHDSKPERDRRNNFVERDTRHTTKKRNKVKRWMREAVRPLIKDIKTGRQIIFLINSKFPYEQISHSLIRKKTEDLLRKAKLFKWANFFILSYTSRSITP